ncbi:MAG: glycosyltransferase family 4 protein [Leptolyngbya sp. SIOISBB]|nr:glycosyltransferase family 4 protein [Leptolyngbya sp. SIOISBB]
MPTQICCIAPNIFGFTGGIQIYTRNLLERFKVILPEAQYTTLLKYDRPVDVANTSVPIPGVHFYCFGQWPRQVQTAMMTLTLLWLAFRHPHMLFIATHVNYAKALWVAKRLFKIRYWVVAHGLEVWNIETGLLQTALRQADNIAAVSQYTRQRLIQEQAISADRIHILVNTFDGERFQIAPKPVHLLQQHGLRPEQKVILTVCRLGGESPLYKGYEHIIRVLPQLKEHFPDIQYVLVGKGSDLKRIQQLVQALNLQDNVILTGFVSDEDLPAYYNLCDVFAMPSTGEGFGIVYLEALSSGKPVLAGNQDGAIDPLLNGELGCLVNPSDRAEILTQLLAILQGHYPNHHLYQPEYLREQAIAHFSINQFQAQLCSLLQHQGIANVVSDSSLTAAAKPEPCESALKSPMR